MPMIRQLRTGPRNLAAKRSYGLYAGAEADHCDDVSTVWDRNVGQNFMSHACPTAMTETNHRKRQNPRPSGSGFLSIQLI